MTPCIGMTPKLSQLVLRKFEPNPRDGLSDTMETRCVGRHSRKPDSGSLVSSIYWLYLVFLAFGTAVRDVIPAPSQVVKSAIGRLIELFGDHRIGRHGPHAWPPRSPDLTPLDFFLWGCVKDRAFDRTYQNIDSFKERKQRSLRETLESVHESTLHRARFCLHVASSNRSFWCWEVTWRHRWRVDK